MGETDVIIIKKLQSTCMLDIKQCYRQFQTWFKEHGYDQLEKEHDDFTLDQKKTIKFEIDTEKFVDDYLKFVIEFEIAMKNCEPVKVKKKGVITDMLKGVAEVEVRGMIEHDYDAKWEGTPWKKFIRAVYDKYFHTDKNFHKEAELKNEVNLLIKDLKEFFKMHQTE